MLHSLVEKLAAFHIPVVQLVVLHSLAVVVMVLHIPLEVGYHTPLPHNAAALVGQSLEADHKEKKPHNLLELHCTLAVGSRAVLGSLVSVT